MKVGRDICRAGGGSANQEEGGVKLRYSAICSTSPFMIPRSAA